MSGPLPFTLHFISGLPRAGSTLLSAILRQNPRVRAGVTGPLGGLVRTVQAALSADTETAVFVNDAQREHILRGLFTSYYHDVANDAVVLDTNRLWCARLPFLRRVFPGSKTICCVRDVGWVMDSLERLHRRHCLSNSLLFVDETERNTVYSRVDTLGQRNRLVGFAWCAVKEAFHSEEGDDVLLVDYDLLVGAPEKTLPLVYQFLGLPAFDHDFDAVEYDEPAFDDRLGLAGMHRVSGPVRPRPRPTILPPDLFEQYSAMSFWRRGATGRANVIAPKEPEPAPALAPPPAPGPAPA